MLRSFSRRSLLASAAALGAGGLALSARAGEEETTSRLNGWLETRYDFWLARSPMQQGYLGLTTNASKWDDIGEVRQQDDQERLRQELTDIRDSFRLQTLSPAGQLSYRLYQYRNERLMDAYLWRRHLYPVSQVEGWQQVIPAFLMNVHKVESVDDAQAYIARLLGVGALIDQVIEQMRLAESAGILAPRFAYEHALRDCRNLLRGAPFDKAFGEPSPLWADFMAKVGRLATAENVKEKLRNDAVRVMATVVRPAFQKLMAMCQEQGGRAGTDDGAWKHPEGEAFYANRLAFHTTTDMSAGDIHVLGLNEVERIHGEMRALMQGLGFNSDLKAFFAHVKSAPRFYYPQTPDGKAAYIARTMEIIAAMRERLGDVVEHVPRALFEVKPVETFREQSATAAFYQPPGTFDNRPGIYYVNTYDMRVMPKFEMEALAYHEAIPGHHLQVGLTQELDELPRFRRYASYTAYDEGWGLYCERLAREMGFYQDPYSEFGRLSSELWRACRLVVDTGIHMGDKRWTRARAIAYLSENTPNSSGDIANSVERYIVNPGQATAYKIGMERILALREDAKARLGEKFDIKEFHKAVLGNGAVPLPILGEIVEAWVRAT